MKTVSALICGLSMMSVGGCCCNQKPAPSTTITLDKAVQAVQSALDSAYANRPKDHSNGFVPDATVVFQITDATTDGKSLGVSLGGGAYGVTASVNGNVTHSDTLTMGNTITIHFINILNLPKDSIGGNVTQTGQLIYLLEHGEKVTMPAPDGTTGNVGPSTYTIQGQPEVAQPEPAPHFIINK